MKVIVITGSAHKNGTSALLADKFIEGATEAGHEVFRFDAAFETVRPCLACEYCASHNTECVHKDSMEKLYDKLIDADVIAFASPLYYYTVSAQLKVVMDRFHAKNRLISGNKKAVLLATAYGDDDNTMEALDKMFELSLRYLNWESAGKVYAIGCPVREIMETTDFPNKAYLLGKSL
jgi:multimeric flavodoxin WrbA